MEVEGELEFFFFPKCSLEDLSWDLKTQKNTWFSDEMVISNTSETLRGTTCCDPSRMSRASVNLVGHYCSYLTLFERCNPLGFVGKPF